jgi:phosphohistidine swiveling domain-containing protein
MIHLFGEASTGAALGGKARVLNELFRDGYPVPPGFVIPPDASLRELGELGEFELTDAVMRLGGFPVAVRSSGTMEDLAEASFAGQYVTFLDVKDLPTLLARAQACRESALTPQVAAYLEARRLAPEQARMSVLVQRMVDARAAGVCFSIHPLTGREDHALIECCEGLGEKLVAGRVAPVRYVARLRDGAVVSEELPEDASPDARLSPEHVRELVRYALRLQARYGRPQDIEWAIDRAGALWILQSRPVTQVSWRTDIEEYTNADFKDGGVSARVCSPLMYSLYRDAMQESMPRYLKAIRLIPRSSSDTYIDWFYGRPYWNASAVKRALARVPGFDERSFDQDLGIQKNYGDAGPLRVPTTLRTILPALPVALALEREYKAQLSLARRYGPGFRLHETRYLAERPGFGKLEDGAFFGLFAEVLDLHQRTERDYFTTIYNNANAQADFKKVVEKVSAALDREVSLVRLIGGLSDVSHLRIQEGLLRLLRTARTHGIASAEWDRELAAFLDDHYFHGDSELDLTTPRWGEAPARVRAIVEEMLAGGHEPRDPAETIEAQRQAFLDEKRSVLRGLERSWRHRLGLRGSFLKQLARARAYLVQREAMREHSTRSYHLVRVYALEAGRRWQRLGLIGAPEDVFMTTTDELRDWIAGRASAAAVRENVAFRKLMYAGYRAFTPPDELGGGVRQRTAESYADRGEGGTLLLRGTGCSPGVIEGEVRVVEELAQAGSLRKGEILVTRFTDPGWTPVLGVASGVVTEVGGLLSHAAVIGREYGIPAVLNLRGATQALRTGQRVRVDGQAGTVEVLPRS